ncbi:Dyp-type peroxidase [Microseira wollei]|uniref:Dyp-type peroxidase family protein n=1 Tax=Microseira wollei NIES-4236 TaxID=2530354 RepID=A0AAV3XH97_9CYAN|nr:Dyp-type peroxidase [Microseira wollei]GET41978.1 Dyp-type peroxidase family protein [Microseira wollei NIES-4236]
MRIDDSFVDELTTFGRELRHFLLGFLDNKETDVEITDNFCNEPILEVNEIQGNVLPGFNKNYQTLLFLKINSKELTKSWLRQVQPQIATLEEVFAFNATYKAIRKRRGAHTETVQATWINIAFTFDGLKKLTGDLEQFFDLAFKKGMHDRSILLGDPAERNAEGNCNNWLIGSPNQVPDIILIVASDNKDKLADEVSKVGSSLNEGLRIMFKQHGEAPPEPFRSHEHFGFRDGISQPGIRGRLSDNPTDFLTLRENPQNPNQGKPGQDLLWPGEFVFGYPRQDPTDPLKPGPIAEAGPSWARNGSFLVFRRLRQDVEGFRNFLQTVATELAKKNPEFAGITPEKVGAKLMGRWPSGTPILSAPEADIPSIAENSNTDNNFEFGEDALGLVCPHAAHIRKAYPRDDLNRKSSEAEVQTHRLLRRGIPFGKPYPASGERGLLFLAYQTSIERQFEFVTRFWINNPDFRDSGDGYDPIVGQNNREGEKRSRTFVLPIRNANGSIDKISIELPNDWVIPTGGGYFFAPSLSALKYLAAN